MPLDDDQIGREIEQFPSLDPPPDLRASIMGALAATPAPSAVPARRSRRWTFAVGWAAAAAIILSFLVIARPYVTERPVATMAPLARTYESEQLTVTVRRAGDLLYVEPALKTEGPVTIIVRWDPNSVAFSGISGAADASSQNNQTTFLMQGPGDRVAVSLGIHPAARSTELRIVADGEEIVRTDVSLE